MALYDGWSIKFGGEPTEGESTMNKLYKVILFDSITGEVVFEDYIVAKESEAARLQVAAIMGKDFKPEFEFYVDRIGELKEE